MINESLGTLSGSQYFSTLNLVSGYWQVPVDEDAQEKAAFITRSVLWKWKALPLPLPLPQLHSSNSLHAFCWKTLLYLDNIIVIAPDFDTQIPRLEEVFQRLQQAGLKLKPTKCELMQATLRYLGYVVRRKRGSPQTQRRLQPSKYGLYQQESRRRRSSWAPWATTDNLPLSLRQRQSL